MSIPWNLPCDRIASELAWFNKNFETAKETSYRCNHTLWTLEDFRRIVKLPEGEFDPMLIEGGNAEPGEVELKWKEKYYFEESGDPKLDTVVEYLKPLLCRYQPTGTMSGQIDLIIDSFRGDRRVDWAPILFQSMLYSARGAGTIGKVFCLDLIMHFYNGMNSVSRTERRTIFSSRDKFCSEDFFMDECMSESDPLFL